MAPAPVHEEDRAPRGRRGAVRCARRPVVDVHRVALPGLEALLGLAVHVDAEAVAQQRPEAVPGGVVDVAKAGIVGLGVHASKSSDRSGSWYSGSRSLMRRRAIASRRRVRTPRQARSRATVDAIVTATARILVRDGWARLTTNAVARTAGVSIGSLYEYFPDRDALAAGLLERHLARGEAIVAARLAAVGADPPSVAALVDAIVDGAVALHEDDPALHRRLSSEVPVPSALRARADALAGTVVAALAAALRADPTRPTDDPELAAQLVVDAVDALVHRWVVEPSGPIPATRLAAELRRMLAGSLAPRARPGGEESRGGHRRHEA